ncbi:hypothetical protein QUB80_30530 [Chlorogloeopsis sp. ULAP01]|uniref:hypothetical protein n=1 Tax=Chlorogloeopsis sp. ULAP01 TaxID=3056483 RepID=UPI0025AA6740|nr:hypothetical protein [Chlorogloeopsis sp. ULAP01]MDM9384997.1 hypothetical protein [Chlorogloeopsis sp. ULAP01]
MTPGATLREAARRASTTRLTRKGALAPLCRGTRPPSGYPEGTPRAYSNPPILTGSPTLRERPRRTGSGVRNRDGNRQDCARSPLCVYAGNRLWWWAASPHWLPLPRGGLGRGVPHVLAKRCIYLYFAYLPKLRNTSKITKFFHIIFNT